MTNNDGDQLVASYLSQLAAAASKMPADRREELIEEIRSHIAEARAVSGDDLASVRNVLEQLGGPEDIVRAAVETGPGRAPVIGHAGAMQIAAVILLLVGGVVIPIAGWVAGVVMLWASPRWRTSDKILGTLIWPGGVAAPLVIAGLALALPVQTCQTGGTAQSSTCGPPWAPAWVIVSLLVIATLAAICAPFLIAIRLLRQARQADPALMLAAEPAIYTLA